MIGFFDSGVGGLTILKAVHERMPEYDTYYLGDTAHAPYGNKTREEIFDLTWDGCKQLFAQGCGLVILACNTASAAALREIQQTKLAEYPGKSVLGIIRPTVEALARHGHKRIAVLSTIATKNSGAYEKEFAKIDPTISVYV
jgi:glutamate racemase